jgi:hypothetical protein
MIYYICDGRHAYALGVYLMYFRHDFSDRIRIISYDDLFRLETISPGVFIFTDFDRISDDQHRNAVAFVACLREQMPDVMILNDPEQSLTRFKLLQKLHVADHHAPAVTRLANWQDVVAFPVFIRSESDHLPALSDLILSADALSLAANALLATHATPDDVIIIEFKNAPNRHGYFEKYGAFRVGDVIYGQHLYQNRHWWVKDNGSDWTTESKTQNRDYVQQNPHASLLLPYFEMAGIEYGRMDYCVLDGRIVVFEINTNPVINANPQKKNGRFQAQSYSDLHNAALATLPHISGAPIHLPVRGSGICPISVETAHRRMLSRVKRKLLRRRMRARLRSLRIM